MNVLKASVSKSVEVKGKTYTFPYYLTAYHFCKANSIDKRRIKKLDFKTYAIILQATEQVSYTPNHT
jgi:hypothetical protein